VYIVIKSEAGFGKTETSFLSETFSATSVIPKSESLAEYTPPPSVPA